MIRFWYVIHLYLIALLKCIQSCVRSPIDYDQNVNRLMLDSIISYKFVYCIVFFRDCWYWKFIGCLTVRVRCFSLGVFLKWLCFVWENLDNVSSSCFQNKWLFFFSKKWKQWIRIILFGGRSYGPIVTSAEAIFPRFAFNSKIFHHFEFCTFSVQFKNQNLNCFNFFIINN